MTAWTAADNTTWFGASWVADMGPWTGAPPDPIASLPADATEIDYSLGSPDPSGDVTLFHGDYTASTWRGTPGGPLSHSSGGRGAPPDSHLVIVFYPLSGEDPVTTPPSVTPDSLMPVPGPPPPPPPPPLPPVRSTITFHSFNLDPLPAGGPSGTPFYGTPSYGGVVGGDDALDTADGDGSYVRYFPTLGGSPAMITCRARVDPPIPPDATFTSGPTADDIAHSHEQARLETAADYTIRPTWLLSAAPVDTSTVDSWGNGICAVGAAAPRNGTQPYWGTAWWDNSNMGSTGGYSGTYMSSPLTMFAALQRGAYFIIHGGNGDDQGTWTRISQLVLSITWQPATVTVSPPADWLRLNQRGDQYSIDPAIRINAGLGSTPGSKQATIRVGDTNSFR